MILPPKTEEKPKVKTKVKNNTKTPLTLEQRTEIMLKKCQTREELNKWIKYHLGLQLPDCTVSRYSDTNPLDVVWEVYKICVLKQNPDNIQELLYVAGRGSGKTLGMAIAEFLVMLHDQRDTVHVGAIQSQADRCYQYIKGFYYNRKLKDVLMPPKVPEDQRILEKPNMSKSTFNLSPDHQTTLEILPCTMKACNGPHVPLVVVDEIDTVSGEGLKAFKEITGMLDSRPGKQALRVGISTRKSRYGLMNAQIENAEQSGRTVRKWTAFEFHARCPDERSGTTPTDLYVYQDKMEVITPEEFEKKDKQKKNDFVRHTFPGQNCQTCPIAAICLGDAKKQQSASPMLKPVQELIKKAIENDVDWALAQLMNLKPSVEGIIYKEFEEKAHVKNWNEMWYILTGKEFPDECSHDIFVKKCHAMGLSCYAGIDWGWSNPSTVVYFFVDNRENVYVVNCEGRTYLNNPTWAQTIKAKWHQMYRCQLYFPDLANPGDAVTMRTEGLPCPSEQTKDTDSGIQIVKKWLRSLASPMPKIFFNKETCGPIIQEFQMYHFKTDAAGDITDEPEKEYDHWLDALRYAMYELFGKSGMVISTYGMDADIKPLMDKYGSYQRPPSAEEFAASKGIILDPNAAEDKAKLGKIGKKSDLELEEEEDKAKNGGSGGFLWSF